MYIYLLSFSCFSIIKRKENLQYFKPFNGLRNEQISRAPGGATPGPQPRLCSGPAWGFTTPPRPPAVLGNELRHGKRPIYYNSNWAPPSYYSSSTPLDLCEIAWLEQDSNLEPLVLDCLLYSYRIDRSEKDRLWKDASRRYKEVFQLNPEHAEAVDRFHQIQLIISQQVSSRLNILMCPLYFIHFLLMRSDFGYIWSYRDTFWAVLNKILNSSKFVSPVLPKRRF